MSKRASLAALLVAVALIVTACSGDSDSGGGDASANPGADLTGEPVKLFVLYSGGGQTGSDTTETLQGAQVAASAVEAAGGINGRPIQLIGCEDEFDPNVTADCARQAVGDGVLAFVGAFTTYGDNYVPIAEAAGIPVVAPFAISFPEFTSELSYPIIGGSPATTAGMGAQLVDVAGAETINVSYLDIEQGALAATLVGEGLTPRGLEVASETPVPPDTAELAPQIAAATGGGTDGIVVALDEDQNVLYIQQATQQGVDIPLASSSANIGPDALETLGDDAEGLLVTSNFKPTTMDDPGVAQFLSEVDDYEPDLEINDKSMNAWAGVHLLADVLEGKPDATPQDLITALNGAVDVDLGLIPPISFDEATPLFGGAVTRVFNPNVLYTKVENGELVADTGEFVNPFEAP